MEVVTSFRKAFKIVAANQLLQLCEPGISICKLASQVNKALEEDSACTDEFGRVLSDKFYNLLNTQFLPTSMKEKIMRSFHALCTEEEYVKEWDNIILSVGLIPSNTSYSLFNYVMPEVLNKVLKLRNSKILPLKKDLNVELDQSEEETLRYVAGYVLLSLKRSLKSMNKSDAKVILEMLNTWGSKDLDHIVDEKESVEDYSKRWIETISRGGLLFVCDEFYGLIKAIELEVRLVLNKNILVNYCGQNIRSVILQKLTTSEEIDSKWAILTRVIDNSSLKKALRSKIFNKWINIRAHAFVKAWVQMVKRKHSKGSKPSQSLSEKGEPALRKTLSFRKK